MHFHHLTHLLISATAQADVSKTEYLFHRVAQFFQEGGPFMYPIALMSVFALAIIIERFIILYGKYSVNAEKMWSEISQALKKGNVGQALKICDKYSKSALAKVLRAGLEVADKPDYEIQNAIDEAVLEVVPQIQKRTHYLQMAANVATLLGLLGTIVGLIQAFNALATASPAEKQLLLAKGIAVAMNTTAFGLMVAIPSMFIYSILVGKTMRLTDEIDEYSFKLLRELSSLKEEEATVKVKV